VRLRREAGCFGALIGNVTHVTNVTYAAFDEEAQEMLAGDMETQESDRVGRFERVPDFPGPGV
jgi:hypothetical protein